MLYDIDKQGCTRDLLEPKGLNSHHDWAEQKERGVLSIKTTNRIKEQKYSMNADLPR
jgi:hypothetical protein